MIAPELSLNGIKLEMGEHRTGFSTGSQNKNKSILTVVLLFDYHISDLLFNQNVFTPKKMSNHFS